MAPATPERMAELPEGPDAGERAVGRRALAMLVQSKNNNHTSHLHLRNLRLH